MILADTSVWIEHFRRREPRLAAALEWTNVCVHPFVMGELACGRLPERATTIGLLGNLPRPPVGTHEEVLAFIDARRLMGRGIGYVDAHLLASATLGSLRLWTLDRRLAEIADELGLGIS